MSKKILVGVDGSESANRALDYAVALAERLQSSIILLYVIDLPRTTYQYHLPVNMESELEDLGREVLAKCEAKAKEKGIKSETILSEGDPAEKILTTADEKFCDLIVLGRRGLGRFDRLLIGSVSDKVAKHSAIPILITK